MGSGQIVSAIPIILSTLLVSAELVVRYSTQKQKPVSHRLEFLFVNLTLAMASISLSVVTLRSNGTGALFSLVSFETVFLEAAVLRIYQLSALLFDHSYPLSSFIGGLCALCAMLFQIFGAAVYIREMTVQQGEFPIGVSEKLLHCGLASFDLAVLAYFCWILSMGVADSTAPIQTKSAPTQRLKTLYRNIIKKKVLWGFIMPTVLSGIVSTVPLALWCEPGVVFLVNSTLHSLLVLASMVTWAIQVFRKPNIEGYVGDSSSTSSKSFVLQAGRFTMSVPSIVSGNSDAFMPQ